MDARALALAQARGRMIVGASYVLAPTLFGRIWVGSHADTSGARILARAFGARDLALGIGVAVALKRGAPVRGWLEASALSDFIDFSAGLLDRDALPPATRAGVLALGSGSGSLAALLSRAL